MKTSKIYAMIAVIATIFTSCSKSNNDNTTIVTPTVPASNPIAPGNVSGFVKGTFTTGNTYTITGDLTIKPGDTLASQQGVTVVVKGNAQINVQGVLLLVGTQHSRFLSIPIRNSPVAGAVFSATARRPSPSNGRMWTIPADPIHPETRENRYLSSRRSMWISKIPGLPMDRMI